MSRRIIVLALVLGAWLHAAWGYRANGWDWDEVLMLCMGFAGLAYIVVDQVRTSKLDNYADNFDERLTKLELVWAYAAEDADLTALAAHVDRVAERLATAMERLAEDCASELGERVATLEARADFKPWTQTRRKKNGQFGTDTESNDTP
jgi:hypothetical protein